MTINLWCIAHRLMLEDGIYHGGTITVGGDLVGIKSDPRASLRRLLSTIKNQSLSKKHLVFMVED